MDATSTRQKSKTTEGLSSLQTLLNDYRSLSKSEREKGFYFEQLCKVFLENEPMYKDLYASVYLFTEWAKAFGVRSTDTGIDLVAITRTGETHAIQSKLYDQDYTLQKPDIDSFFTASGKKTFTHRIIISTTNKWSKHALDALVDQQPPVTKIDLAKLEESQIDWTSYRPSSRPKLKTKHGPREHQKQAIEKVLVGLDTAERGKLIMACGTGKTFTALKIAEKRVGEGGSVLFLVPSLALLSQTLTEWTQQSVVPLNPFAVCSDSDVGKKEEENEDRIKVLTHELAYPATTDAKALVREISKTKDSKRMTVVFSTYHSISVINEAQHEHSLKSFDLIICDEAHRTTGATFENDDESNFVKVHDKDFIKSKRRLYMTATPRIYGEPAKAIANRDNIAICSMDDETLFGHQLHVLTFSEAVNQGLLVDYKVIVLSVDTELVNERLQDLLKDENNQLKVDDAAKIIGCWKALSKQDLTKDLLEVGEPMKKAVAFCQVIDPSKNAKTHKVSSRNIASVFKDVVEAYKKSEPEDLASKLVCEAEHVDGSMSATEKEKHLQWLKADSEENTCRILTNVRCLSEGVDVPALDAVLFLTPRNSQVDVVQSVGRVMRTSPKTGKKRGYIILPVVIPSGIKPEDALNDNKIYRVVWDVLQALRSHDDRFDAFINKIDLIGKDTSKMEVIAVSNKLNKKSKPGAGTGKGANSARGATTIGSSSTTTLDSIPQKMQFEIGELEKAIYAKLVQKCGNRHHWEEWAVDIAKIAETHVARIKAILKKEANKKAIQAFNRFAEDIRDDINDSVSDDEIIEMLAQHMITKPVFEALFADYDFSKSNPISIAMQGVLEALEEHRLDKETDTLEKFYASVKMRAAGITDSSAKQRIIKELYDKFFNSAFPKMAKKLGIVYTPVEVVDFIINSVNHLLKTEFDQTLGSKGVHIIDPFTGTGTFITRLLQSGLITPAEMLSKYKNEIHANEIMLLAYYIAAINIEAVFHGEIGGSYVPFEGICLTDTFQLYEREDLISQMLVDNSARRKRQKALDIRVIIGNPPYSVGQDSANDNNQNVAYPNLDTRIRETYADRSKATNKNSMYDSYIRAIRWASDRIGKSGIVGFVTNASFAELPTFDGVRKCLASEYSSIYIFHLRGNQRSAQWKKEGGKIFDSGSQAPIAISFLIKNPAAKETGQIFYHDIGDFLTREEKLQKLFALNSVSGITSAMAWQKIVPDIHGDWIRQRDDRFGQYIAMGDKKSDATTLFENYSCGVQTNRDVWVYNYSKASVIKNMERMIAKYNSEVARFSALHGKDNRKAREAVVADFIDTDTTKISWSSSLVSDLVALQKGEFNPKNLTVSLYRPFTKRWLYYDKMFNHRPYQMPRIFPDAKSKNQVICIAGVGAQKVFSALIADCIPDLHTIQTGQCFPLYLYDDIKEEESPDLFETNSEKKRTQREAITEKGLNHFKDKYPGEIILKEDIFYYIYGLFHSPDYLERYADNLSKELPRIPCVNTAKDFWAFSKAGRNLAKLHLEYEKVKPYQVEVEMAKSKGQLSEGFFRVEKMKFGKTKVDGKIVEDRSVLIYNEYITLKEIPIRAYDYVVNGRSALEWVVERQCVKLDTESGITNDANDWASETIGDDKYPLELFKKVITVSLDTLNIIQSLPKLDI
jgi:predicted helicase